MLELYDDIHNNHHYKPIVETAVLNFLENENEFTASEVFKAFFEIYQITGIDKSNENKSDFGNDEPNILLDLVDTLEKYEKGTGDLIEKQRDHYIHSVNVFVLGLAIYAKNENYRIAFLEANNNGYYGSYYKTKHEEFFYRWGIASLFHDIGYPLEIIGKQMKKFINDGVNVIYDDYDVITSINFEDFNKFNTIAKIRPDFTNEYRKTFEEANFLDLFKPLDILAHKISLAFDDINLNDLKEHLDDFINTMAHEGFIDHGFFSSILVLLVYGYLIQKYNKKHEFFFFPVVDSANAILLHNYYRNVLMKKFKRGKLEVTEHPIAYLLILCDELQEWNRTPFGVQDRKKARANECNIKITDSRMVVEYIIKNGALPVKFAVEKRDFLYDVLDLDGIFDENLAIKARTEDIEVLLIDEAKKIDIETPSQLIKNIEKLAIITHDYYNKLREKEGETVKYPNFDDLPGSMVYSNFRQARSIPKKLSLIGCEIVPKTDKRWEIKEFTPKEVEFLAEVEHEDWNKERIATGWTYGEEKDDDKKITPYLVPWDELDEKIKKYDRNPVNNIPKILNKIDMKVVGTNLRILALRIHDCFIKISKEEGLDVEVENFLDLPLNIQYSNYKQSEFLPDLFETIGYKLANIEDEGDLVKLSKKELMSLAKVQHEFWLNDRLNSGWNYGKVKDESKKLNPNLVKWNNLDKKVKKVNIRTLECLLGFLKKLDLKLVKI